MAGNSLGLLPRRAREIVNQELDVWSARYDPLRCNVHQHLLEDHR